MNKSIVIFFIISLVLFTALIKNSSKKIEEEILIVQENLRDLKKQSGDLKLEFGYLSSAEKILEFQSKYFEQDLTQKDIFSINIIKKKSEKLEVKDLKFGE